MSGTGKSRGPWRPALCFALALAASAAAMQAAAQTRVRTETIRPPAGAAQTPDQRPQSKVPPAEAGTVPAIVSDLSRLPAPVARMRTRILEAARSGDPAKLVALMQANGPMPVFSLSDHKDPAAFWKANYPDSDGLEALAILISILETPFVHVEKGTAHEAYVWPYFARMPLKSLTAAQKVELFRIVTGADYKDMIDFGAYSFYRLGIGPDGTWHFFVSGD